MRELDGTLFGAEQTCFGCGPANGIGLKLKFTELETQVETRFTPSELHQGPLGVMHGGLVFTLADELAAWAIIAKLGKFGFTTRFEGKLQKPTRVGTELTGRAQIVRSSSRIAEVETVLSQSEDVFVARFTFVLMDRAGAEKLMGRPLPEEWVRFTR